MGWSEQHGACIASMAYGCSPGTTVPFAQHCLHSSLMFPSKSELLIRIINFSSDPMCGSVGGTVSSMLWTNTCRGLWCDGAYLLGDSPAPSGMQVLTIHWSSRLCTKHSLEKCHMYFPIENYHFAISFLKNASIIGVKRKGKVRMGTLSRMAV